MTCGFLCSLAISLDAAGITQLERKRSCGLLGDTKSHVVGMVLRVGTSLGHSDWVIDGGDVRCQFLGLAKAMYRCSMHRHSGKGVGGVNGQFGWVQVTGA